ncbi:MAG: 4'-phosphopantetheinyl transferase superfamily protein [Ectothiorhodospiraceae bacterium]|nr:4'-phosphopantetheinyl transferase superfamily protein [Ectothiorhodospiraceae bacterium]
MNVGSSSLDIAYHGGTTQCPAPTWKLGADQVHIWLAELDHPSWPVAALSASLSPDEVRRAGTYVLEQRQRRFIIARGLLRRLLAGYLSVEPGSIRLRYGDSGKPELATPSGNPPLRFNSSYSRGLALYALARGRRIGVDLEMLRPVPEAESIASEWFSPHQQSVLLAIDPHHYTTLFLRYWTGKEAYAKAMGHGLRDELKGVETPLATHEAHQHMENPEAAAAAGWSLRELQPTKDCVGVLAVEGGHCRLSSGLITPTPLVTATV